MKKISIILLLMFVLPIRVFADSIILNCPDTIDKNADFICELSGKTDANVSSLSATVVLSEGLSFTSFIPKNVWQGDGANGDIELYTDVIQKGTFSIGNIKIKSTATASATVSINDVSFFDDNDKERKVANVSKNISIKNSNVETTPEPDNDQKEVTPSDDNPTENNNNNNGDDLTIHSYYLIDIKIDGYNLDFVREETEYTLKIKNESSLKITPVLEDEEASYEILGNNKLKNGSVIRIQVTSADNNIQTYRITISKDETIKKSYTHVFIAIIIILILVNIVRIIINEKKRTGEE